MEQEHFGQYLRKRREARGMSLADLSRATKIKERHLALLEDEQFANLPARVFVTGFVGAYARALGLDPSDALERYSAAAPAPSPSAIGDCMRKVVARAPEGDEAQRPAERRRLTTTALVVFLLLVVATLTLSLLLHHGPRAAGLS